jgi:hypothetical protein
MKTKGIESGKPSQWLRDGCTFAPQQAFGALMLADSKAACALATMLLGELKPPVSLWHTPDADMFELYARLYDRSKTHRILSASPGLCCPVCRRLKPRQLERLIIHLNDEHRWERKQIADWLEEKGL